MQCEEMAHASEGEMDMPQYAMSHLIVDKRTLFHNTGAIIYCDENGKVTGLTDVFDRVEACRKHFASVGLGADYVDNFIR